MKIKSVRIQNFRSIKDELLELDEYTCLVGANGSGKSNLFHALNVFFLEAQTPGLDPAELKEGDFHCKNTENPITITVTFSGLSADAQKDLSDYYRNGKLIVTAQAMYDKQSQTARLMHFGKRLGINDFAKFFDALKEGKLVSDLRDIYSELRERYPDLPNASTKDGMSKNLRDYETSNHEKCDEIPSGDQFYGVSKGRNLLAKHIQWVYVPAVKDAATEHIEGKNSALGKLLSHTVREKIKFDDAIRAIKERAQGEYQKILNEGQRELESLSANLKKKIMEWAHPDASLKLEWRQDQDKSIKIDQPFAQAIAGEGNFEGEITRFGHGFQRSFLLALLQELAGIDIAYGPTLILACEEPELYQHPPQARHLYKVFQDLILKKSQVLICTHSPYFISGQEFEQVRVIRKVIGKTNIFRTTISQVAELVSSARGDRPSPDDAGLAKIHQALQPVLSEMFFTPKLILVEGYEDIAYITTHLHLLELWDVFRRLMCHIIPVDGKSKMAQPLAIAKCLKIPNFIVFDSDGDQPDRNGSREMHRKDNLAVLKICDINNPEPFPDNIFCEKNVFVWPSNIGKVVGEEIGTLVWERIRNKSDLQYGQAGGLRKNTLHIATSLNSAWKEGHKSSSLELLCSKLIEFGKRTREE